MPITLHIDGRMSVANLKDDFKKFTGCSLRVYRDEKGHLADDRMHLSDVRLSRRAQAVGDLECRPNLTVGNFCKRMCDEFGIEVKVASPDDWVLADNRLTLSEVANLKAQPTRKKMDEIALGIVKEMGNEDIKTAADEVYENGKNNRNGEYKRWSKMVTDLLDAIDECKRKKTFKPLIDLLEKYPIVELLTVIGLIISGNPLGLTAAVLALLRKLYLLLQHYEPQFR